MSEPAHILVVDDDTAIRRMFQILLTGVGYRVSLAGSGEEALAFLDLVTPDLIMLDLNLPGMNGRQITETIKADPKRPFVPIILVTAQGDQGSKVTALDAGADEFLVKPVEFSELLARIRAMLRLQRSQRLLRTEQRKSELLLHLTRELGTTFELDGLLSRFLDRLADAVGAVRASIILVSNTQPRLFSSTRYRATIALSDILRDGIAGWVLRERTPQMIAETRDDPRWVAVTPLQRAVRSVVAVPVQREDRVLGVLTLVHHTPGYFTDEHLDLVTSVAAQCAVALDQAELFQLTQAQKVLIERRAEELQRINQLSRLLTELMPPDHLMRLVAHLIHYTFGYPHVGLLTREGDQLEVRATAGDLVGAEQIGERLPADAGVLGWAISNRAAVCVRDLQYDARSQRTADDPVRAQLTVPIVTSRSIYGVIDLLSHQPGAFEENDVQLITTLAGQLSIALENARLFDEEQQRVGQLTHVNNLSIAITAQLDPTENVRIAAEAMATIFRVSRSGVLADANAGITCVGAPDTFVALLPGMMRLLDGSAAAVVLEAADQPARHADIWQVLVANGVEAVALAPLITGGRSVGLMALDVSGRSASFRQHDLPLFETVVGIIGQALENARLYRAVEQERGTLNAVLSGAADPILLIDPQLQLLLANRAARERLHINDGDLPLTEPQQLIAMLNSGADTGEIELPDGGIFTVRTAPVRSADDALLGRVAVLQDISAIRELERREQERLRSVFRRYLSPQVVEEVLAGGATLGEPAEHEVVVLFTDLRGYTSLAEGLSPRILVDQVLNRYFTAMTTVLHQYDGTVDKFLGDGVIGLFGVPIRRADDIARAIAASVDLQLAVAQLRTTWQRDLDRDIGMGIGISYGRAIVGNIGSEQRMDYTVIGDVVNTASRLNGLAMAGQIMVSHSLVDALLPGQTTAHQLRSVGNFTLKGKHEPHLVYEVVYSVPDR